MAKVFRGPKKVMEFVGERCPHCGAEIADTRWGMLYAGEILTAHFLRHQLELIMKMAESLARIELQVAQ